MPVTRTLTLEPEHVAIVLHPTENPLYFGPGTADDSKVYTATVLGRAVYRMLEDPTGQMTMESSVLQIMREDGAPQDALDLIMSSYAKNFDAIFDKDKK